LQEALLGERFVRFINLGFQGYFGSIKQCFLGLLGDFDLDHYIESPFPFASVTLLVVYVVVVTILLLNLLIAMMGDTYADVKKSAKKLWFVRYIFLLVFLFCFVKQAFRTSTYRT
jgi:transient receptor potential cation channel subfamily V protein 6